MSADMSGPAFPETRTEWNPDADAREVTSLPGMTLRDYFAAKAMQSIITKLALNAMEKHHAEALAKSSYWMADAMLKERSK